MKIFLKSDGEQINNLSPFTKTRPISELRIGIFTIREKWEMLLASTAEIVSSIETGDVIQINSAIIPTQNNYLQIIEASKGNSSLPDFIKVLQYPWQIFQWNEEFLRADFELITEGRKSIDIDNTNTCKNPANIFIEPGAQISMCMINAEEGPVYIGKNALIMEGCMLRGPITIGENAVVKMGTKIYGATSIGKGCVAGGEIKNSILFENSNKAHDGYLGDSVIGAWCNLGAGTSASNVKNSAANITYQIENSGRSVSVGNKAGLIMGDYSRCAINTSFNTGTIVGTGCNIFETGFPPKNVRNFSWGKERYRLEKLLTDISNWKKMKGHSLSENEINKLTLLYSTEK